MTARDIALRPVRLRTCTELALDLEFR